MTGTDQTFNMLMGRDVMVANKVKPQAVLALKILEGTDGTKKMSKSLDNYITITDTPSRRPGQAAYRTVRQAAMIIGP